MTKLTEIKGGFKVNPRLIESIEAVLAAAKSGEIVSFAGCGLDREGRGFTSFYNPKGGDCVALLGEVVLLQNALMVAFCEAEGSDRVH